MTRIIPPAFTKTCHDSPYPKISPSKPTLSAKGKVIIVTGGGTGIGKATAAAFIEAEAQAVILIGRTEATLKATQVELSLAGSSPVHYYVADITDPTAIEKAFSATVQQYGKIDVLVNNAGSISMHKPLADSPLDDYWETFEINIKGPIITSQAFLKLAKPGATLINVSSSCAVLPYSPSWSGYSAAKLASCKIMEYVQRENPELRVFNLQPGTVETDITRKGGAVLESWDDPGLPGAFCVWLASHESEFLRGRFLWSNWDVEELKARSEEIVEKELLTIVLNGIQDLAWN
ncbi:NAD(P)-binding protein [Stipitochalara longipes BDJ]|nr:NAD(P)-binding protein [Stipitochalara longipes BDJ]